MKEHKFYVVWAGRKPGIYDTWEECEANTKGFRKTKFRSFESHQEALEAYGKCYEDYLPKRTVRKVHTLL